MTYDLMLNVVIANARLCIGLGITRDRKTPTIKSPTPRLPSALPKLPETKRWAACF